MYVCKNDAKINIVNCQQHAPTAAAAAAAASVVSVIVVVVDVKQ